MTLQFLTALLPKSRTRSFRELTRVKALECIREGDHVMPKGATGTIVHVYAGGDAYEVEFTFPKHEVVFVRRELLARI